MRTLTVSKSWLLLTLALFIFGALMPFFAVYDVPDNNAQGASSSIASAFSEKILICTADGFEWVSRADLESGKAAPTQHSEIKCPLCYLASKGQKITAATMAEAVTYFATYTTTSAIDLHDDGVSSQRIVSRYESRAPPYSTIIS